MKNEMYRFSLDVGTTKIMLTAARINRHGNVEVIGKGEAISTGIMRGVVHNIELTAEAIRQVVEQVEENAGVVIERVNVGIAGQHIKSMKRKGHLTREDYNQEIDQGDINKLKHDIEQEIENEKRGSRIIHILPQEFVIDSEEGIIEPKGMAGIKVQGDFHVTIGDITSVNNIIKCVEKAGLAVDSLILEPLASATAVLNAKELEAGVALVDIGGGTTDVAIFYDGVIRHTAVIPFGGKIVTKDIREGCMVMKEQAEKLKIKYGCSLALKAQENQIISINTGFPGRPNREISVYNLANIIQARMEEIMNMVDFEIKKSGYADKLIAGVVLTGGGSQLKFLPQLTEFVTGLHARVGQPSESLANTSIKGMKDPKYATGVGLASIALGRSPIGGLNDEHIIPDWEEEYNNKSSFTPSNNKRRAPKLPKSKEVKDESLEHLPPEIEKKSVTSKIGNFFKGMIEFEDAD